MLTTYVVDRAVRYPFLTLRRLKDEEGILPGMCLLKLTGDEYENYEQCLKHFISWQNMMANAGDDEEQVSDAARAVIGEPHGGALA